MDTTGYTFYKKNPGDKIWRVEEEPRKCGKILFSFDKKKIYNLFLDYPTGHLSKEEEELFEKENPFWKEFCKGQKAKAGK